MSPIAPANFTAWPHGLEQVRFRLFATANGRHKVALTNLSGKAVTGYIIVTSTGPAVRPITTVKIVDAQINWRHDRGLAPNELREHDLGPVGGFAEPPESSVASIVFADGSYMGAQRWVDTHKQLRARLAKDVVAVSQLIQASSAVGADESELRRRITEYKTKQDSAVHPQEKMILDLVTRQVLSNVSETARKQRQASTISPYEYLISSFGGWMQAIRGNDPLLDMPRNSGCKPGVTPNSVASGTSGTSMPQR